MQNQSIPTVCLDRDSRGRWELGLPDQRERLSCETIDEAQDAAYRSAVERRPCELIVRDAYHRVLHHEVIEAAGTR